MKPNPPDKLLEKKRKEFEEKFPGRRLKTISNGGWMFDPNPDPEEVFDWIESSLKEAREECNCKNTKHNEIHQTGWKEGYTKGVKDERKKIKNKV